jgi:ubiquitin carboxyl-terminal hydrolase 7
MYGWGRRQVYMMPHSDTAATSNIPLALQSMFYKLQYQDSSVSTKDLTQTFGWDANESFMQHDVQVRRIDSTPSERG